MSLERTFDKQLEKQQNNCSTVTVNSSLLGSNWNFKVSHCKMQTPQLLQLFMLMYITRLSDYVASITSMHWAESSDEVDLTNTTSSTWLV